MNFSLLTKSIFVSHVVVIEIRSEKSAIKNEGLEHMFKISFLSISVLTTQTFYYQKRVKLNLAC